MIDVTNETSDGSESDASVPTWESKPRRSSTASVSHLAISPDGQWLASSSHSPPSPTSSHSSSPSHTSTKTHIYNLDSISHHTTLPSFPLPVQQLTFIDSPDSTSYSNLLLTFPNNSIQVYDVEKRQFPVWGKTLSTVLDQRLRTMHDAVLGAFTATASTSDGRTKKRALLFWSATWICKIGLNQSLLRPYSSTHSSSNSKRKRRRGRETDKKPTQIRETGGLDEEDVTRPEQDMFRGVDFKMITAYRPVLCVDRINVSDAGSSELVVVERPLVDVLATLPPAYFKHRYGRA